MFKYLSRLSAILVSCSCGQPQSGDLLETRFQAYMLQQGAAVLLGSAWDDADCSTYQSVPLLEFLHFHFVQMIIFCSLRFSHGFGTPS